MGLIATRETVWSIVKVLFVLKNFMVPLYLVSVCDDVSVSALLYELITSFYSNRCQYPTEMKGNMKE